ncbi:PEPxxWA-CTERM sorting domain-containing protein [Phenylobacterium sp.]
MPEPATWAMMIIGFAGVGGAIRSNRRKNLAFATA